MNTIELASQEYWSSSGLGEDIDHNVFTQIFSAGVEFAQEWIPVEEELPTVQGHYFVKCKVSYPKNCNIIVAEFYEDNKTFYSESLDCAIYDVTHWKPINKK